MTATEPKNNKEKLSHLFKVSEMDEEAVEHLTTTMRMYSLLHLLKVDESKMEAVLKEGVFGPFDLMLVMNLKAWIEDYKAKHEGKLPTK
jgi:hypothetical protein